MKATGKKLKNITIDELAIMVAKGFENNDTHFEKRLKIKLPK